MKDTLIRKEIQKSHLHFICKWLVNSDPEGTRTPNLLIRNQMLYPIEPRGRLRVQK